MDENQGDRNSDEYSEGNNDHNEMHNLRELALGDCWKPMMNKIILEFDNNSSMQKISS